MAELIIRKEPLQTAQAMPALYLSYIGGTIFGNYIGETMKLDLPVIAGTISTIIFAVSTLPMLIKAYRTKDLSSYSLGNILLSNIGNLIHSVYIFQLPPGPIWLLHGFHFVTTGMMLIWYLRYEWRPVLPEMWRRIAPRVVSGQQFSP